MVNVSFPALLDGEHYTPGLSKSYVAAKYGVPIDDIAKLGSAENPFGASPAALDAIRSAAGEAHLYPDWTAAPLREAVAARYDLHPDGVVCGAGETEVIAMIIRAFAKPDDAVLMHRPCFPVYHIYCRCEGRRPVFVEMGDDFDFKVDAYIDALKAKPRIAFITTPHNPTGKYLSDADVKRICDAADPETLIVLDEAYIHYAETEGRMFLLGDYDNVILLRTFSKAYGLAGLRVGFGVSRNHALIAPLMRIKPTWNLGRIQIAGAIAALNDDNHVAKTVETIVAMRAYVESIVNPLPGFRVVAGSKANFFLLKIEDGGLRSTALFDHLLQNGVITKNGLDIEGLGDRYLRVDVNIKKHMDRLTKSLYIALRDEPRLAS